MSVERPTEARDPNELAHSLIDRSTELLRIQALLGRAGREEIPALSDRLSAEYAESAATNLELKDREINLGPTLHLAELRLDPARFNPLDVRRHLNRPGRVLTGRQLAEEVTPEAEEYLLQGRILGVVYGEQSPDAGLVLEIAGRAYFMRVLSGNDYRVGEKMR